MRIVVKVGTHAIAAKTGRPDYPALRRLVAQLCALSKAGDEVVFVSSGAVAAGVEALGLKARPTNVNDIQMCAAVGQARFIYEYERLFAAGGVRIGQVLLTHDDFEEHRRAQNVRKSIDRLVRAGIVPIINENDVVADEELKGKTFGDNDWLSFLIAKLVRADVLVLLTSWSAPATRASSRRAAWIPSSRRSRPRPRPASTPTSPTGARRSCGRFWPASRSAPSSPAARSK